MQKGQVICIIEAMKLMNEIEVKARSAIFFKYIYTSHTLLYSLFFFNENDVVLFVHPLPFIIGLNCSHAQFGCTL